MTFIASRAFGIFGIVLTIGIVALLWFQCRNNGCGISLPQQAQVSATPTPVTGFGTNEIHVTSPVKNAGIASPVTVQGEAIPDWFIGSSFTIRLLDRDGYGLAYAQARPTTTTPSNGFIPFTATFAFFPYTPDGTLLFERNLGSGLPDFPTTVAMPVAFLHYSTATPTPEARVAVPTATPTPTATPAQTGTLQGHVTIGPICPAEQAGKQCTPSVKMYAERTISVYKPDTTTLVTTINPGPTGEFSKDLAPGEYYISMVPQIMGSITGVPTTVTIKLGTVTNLDIAVDTGIRAPAVNTSTDSGF